eukprot:TRINITY_DN27467_c0_g1_i1.p1 TRINITY_DN27467_c0_g1~~TRINITY_DN27467_c0_g1_i1.p1  ORF type:complete len:188 (+),score=46.40 TRINITY_DN27467_c0_g1_i1:118-681(+)
MSQGARRMQTATPDPDAGSMAAKAEADSPTFVVIMNFDDAYEVGYLCAAVNAAYCKRWGHRFFPVLLTGEDMKTVCCGRHFAWAKVALFMWLFTPQRCEAAVREVFERCWQRMLDDGLGPITERVAALVSSVRYLVWVDGDAMVINHDTALRDFLADGTGPEQKAMVLAEDMSWVAAPFDCPCRAEG